MWPFKKKIVEKPVTITVCIPIPKIDKYYINRCYQDHPFLEVDSQGVVQVVAVKDNYVKISKKVALIV